MSKFSSIPDFNETPGSIAVAVRAIKDVVEQLSGRRQGSSLGAPIMYVQQDTPTENRNIRLHRGDLWINDSNDVMSWWTGTEWRPMA